MVNDSFAMHPYDVVVTPERIVALGEYPDLGPNKKNWEIGYLLGVSYNRRTGKAVPILKPNMHMRYEAIRGAVDREGALHLLWGEIAAVTVSDTTGGRGARQIWSATWADGVMSTPSVVVGGIYLGWEEIGVSTIQTDPQGTMHIVVPELSVRSWGGFVHLHRSGGAWTADTVRTASVQQSQYMALALRDSSVHVLLIAPEKGVEGDINSVWYIKSPDRGEHWSREVKVQQSRDLPAYGAQLSIAPDGELRAFWGQHYEEHPSLTRAIRPARSRDDGRSWTIERDYDVLNDLRYIRNVSTNACGTSTLHLITDPTGTYGLASSIGWRDGRWETEVPFLDPDLFVGRSVLTEASRTELVRVWSSGVYRPGAPLVMNWYESHAQVALPNDRRP